MRLRSYGIILGICFLTFSDAAKLPKSYTSTPALLHISAIKQHDSIGFNIVKALQELIYPKLLTGDLALWQGSDKKKIVMKKKCDDSRFVIKKKLKNSYCEKKIKN